MTLLALAFYYSAEEARLHTTEKYGFTNYAGALQDLDVLMAFELIDKNYLRTEEIQNFFEVMWDTPRTSRTFRYKLKSLKDSGFIEEHERMYPPIYRLSMKGRAVIRTYMSFIKERLNLMMDTGSLAEWRVKEHKECIRIHNTVKMGV